jgi:hypothetical protein
MLQQVEEQESGSSNGYTIFFRMVIGYWQAISIWLKCLKILSAPQLSSMVLKLNTGTLWLTLMTFSTCISLLASGEGQFTLDKHHLGLGLTLQGLIGSTATRVHLGFIILTMWTTK